MTTDYRFRPLKHSTTNPSHGWKQTESRDAKCSPPEIPLPQFPPALDLNMDGIMSLDDQVHTLEKVIVRKVLSSSDSSSLNSATSWSSLPLWKVNHEAHQLPPKRHIRLLRHLRLTIFTTYHRLFSLTFIANTIGLLLLLLRNHSIQDIKIETLAIWASTNFLVSILFRYDSFINVLYRTAWLVPWSVPLRIRRSIARVYAYGGIHSGAAVAGTMWFLAFTTLVTLRFVQQQSYAIPVLVLTWLILVVLLTILICALPHLRSRYHNTFEMTHRFLGWTSIILFWAQLFMMTSHSTQSVTNSSTFLLALLHSPTFWNLTIITALLLHPWLHLRKWTFTAEKLSRHALRLHFPNSMHRFSCLSISASPLKEWHPFATFPSTDPTQPGSSLIISAAGDWTTNLIQATASGGELKFWVKGSPIAGVLSLSCIFSRVVILTTGSGIGPSLSSLLDRPKNQSIRLIWSTRSPIQTFGKDIVDEVESVDPDAVIIDTDLMGRPDLVRVAWKVVEEVQAEALFVLSNERVTRKVVYGLESRGIPAYGPIWDS